MAMARQSQKMLMALAFLSLTSLASAVDGAMAGGHGPAMSPAASPAEDCPFEIKYEFLKDVLVNTTVIIYYQWSAEVSLTNNLRQDVEAWTFAVNFSAGEYLQSVTNVKTDPPLEGIALFGKSVNFSAPYSAPKIKNKFSAGAITGANIFLMSLSGVRRNPAFPSPKLPKGLQFVTSPQLDCSGATPKFDSATPNEFTVCCKGVPIIRPAPGPDSPNPICKPRSEILCNGKCVSRALECCGNITCDAVEGRRCADRRKSLCCKFGERVCGRECLPADQECCAGQACESGEFCANRGSGLCCELGERECHGKCIKGDRQCCGPTTTCGRGKYCATRSLCCDLGDKPCKGDCISGGARC